MRNRIRQSLPLLTLIIFLVSCSTYQVKRISVPEDQLIPPRDNPNVLKLDSKKGELLYYGAIHSIDMKNSQNTEIEKLWDSFQPTLAFSEGGVWPLEKNRYDAITKHGEQGLLRYLASRDNVPIESIDSTMRNQAIFLRRKYSPIEIKMYFVLIQTVINRRLERKTADVLYVTIILKSLAKISLSKNIARNLGNYYNLDKNTPQNLEEFEYQMSKKFPEIRNWKDIPSSYFYDFRKGKFLPKIHQELNVFRDRLMLAKLVNKLKKSERILVVAGRSHLVRLEPSLHFWTQQNKREER